MAVPENVADQLTVTVAPVPEMVLPVPVTVQTYPVAPVADVVNAVPGVPWQIVGVAGVMAVGVPTPVGTTTVPLAQVVVLHAPDART